MSMSIKERIEKLRKRKQKVKEMAIKVAALAAVLSASPTPANAMPGQNKDKESDNISTVEHNQTFSTDISYLDNIDHLDQATLESGNWITFKRNINKAPKVKKITPEDKEYIRGASGAYVEQKNTIYMQEDGIRPTEETLQSARQSGTSHSAEYMNGNTAAILSVYFHELGHWNASSKCDIRDLKYPYDIYRCDRVDEKRSKAIEYLHIANLYTSLDQKGVKTFEFNGNQVSTESLLDFYPGLRDYIKENGFSANNEQQIREITQIASDFWEQTNSEVYKKQHYNQAFYNANPQNLMEYTETDGKKYAEVMQKMGEAVDIGGGVSVKIPIDVLDNTTYDQFYEFVKDKPIHPDTQMTFGEVSYLRNHYLEQGINKSEDMMKQLNKDYKIHHSTQQFMQVYNSTQQGR